MQSFLVMEHPALPKLHALSLSPFSFSFTLYPPPFPLVQKRLPTPCHAVFPDGTGAAIDPPGLEALDGPELHHGLVEVPWPVGVQQLLCQVRDPPRQRVLAPVAIKGPQSASNADDVAIYCGLLLAKGDGRHSG